MVALDRDGGGVIVEARWGPMGVPLGQFGKGKTRIGFERGEDVQVDLIHLFS